MKIEKSEYKRLKDKVEKELRNYPYYLLNIESPGLGGATKWDEIKCKEISQGSMTEKKAMDNEYMRRVVNAVDYVYDRLDDTSKRIIDLFYYRDDWDLSEILNELKIDKNRFYKLKSKTLNKFIIVLGYL